MQTNVSRPSKFGVRAELVNFSLRVLLTLRTPFAQTQTTGHGKLEAKSV